MKLSAKITASLLAFFGFAVAGYSVGAKPDKEPKEEVGPVQITLVAKKATYKLDLGGKSTEDFQKLLQEAGEKGGAFPPAPQVDLVLELKNTTDNDLQIWIGGDPTSINLQLKGKGAQCVVAQKFFTRIFIGPKAITLGAGKTHSIPIKGLQYGFRGQANRAYWTQPGEYTLSARFVTGINPAPKGSKEAEDGFGKVTLQSMPIKLKVEGKE